MLALVQNISTGLGLFWDNLKKKSSETSDFWNLFYFAKPLIVLKYYKLKMIPTYS